MAPQPLLRVNSKARVFFDLLATPEKQHLVVEIARVIAIWSSVEAILGRILANLLMSEAVGVIEMYKGLSRQGQMAALSAAARSSLPEPYREAFEAALIAIRRLGSQRDEFAHHAWGWSPELPDALLLADPKVQWEHTAQLGQSLARDELSNDVLSWPELDTQRIKVYRHQDLVDVSSKISRAWSLAYRLEALITFRDDQRYNRLCSEPEVRSALSRMRKSHENAQEALPLPLQTTDVY